MDESERPDLPASLRAVAYFTILCGIGTALTIIVDLFHDKLNINFGVLLIPAGFGLLRLDAGWRKFTLFMLWMGMIAFGAGCVVLVAGWGDSKMFVYGTVIPFPSRALAAATCGAVFVVQLVQYRVLTRPDVRRLFGLTSKPGGPSVGRERDSGPGGSASGPLPGS